jgi:large subunit ribosomal protein L19
MNLLEQIRREGLKTELPAFEVGDTVKVHVRVVEGQKTRTQVFQGVVVDTKGGSIVEVDGERRRVSSSIEDSFTVRKVSQGVGVERVFPVHSPNVQQIEVTRKGRVRRARLNYLRGRTGKAARIGERRMGATGDEE